MLKCFSNGVFSRAARALSTAAEVPSIISKLEGKVAIITGGASGIGAATAKLFAENGAKLVIADVQDDLGQELAKQLGSSSQYIHCDVSKEEDVRALIDDTMSKHHQLDIMFNNAGITTDLTNTLLSISQTDLSTFNRICDVNVRGVLLGVKYASRAMIPRKTGSIINTSSVASILAQKHGHIYTITKHAVVGITKTAASELCAHGIRVNCISPFFTVTPLAINIIKQRNPATKAEEVQAIAAQNSQLCGLKLEASDIGNAALFLGSDDGKFISGHNLVVDGSFTATKTFHLLKNPHE